jgi:Na+/proline symporter
VQRYLTGKSITQSRLSLLFNAVAKLPMQFFILFTGAMVFVFFTFEMPPAVFQREALARASRQAAFPDVQKKFAMRFEERKRAAMSLIEARRNRDADLLGKRAAEYREAQKQFEVARNEALRLAREASGEPSLNDANYIFLTFVTRYLPAGLVGLVMAAIFAAAMSTISAEINSLATVTVIDIYRRHICRSGSDRHYLVVSRLATALWGAYAIVTAQYARNLGSLIVVVNQVGSLFYGGLLGVFVLAFACKRVNGTAAFTGVLCGEMAIFAAHFYGKIAFLWYNMIGCVVVVGSALLVSAHIERKRRQLHG